MYPEIEEIVNLDARLVGNMWSEDMRFAHYNLLAKEIAKEVKKKKDGIIITHGTDTMCDTAKLLGEKGINKTIVLFGSMVPYAVNNSDAMFNFGCALGSLQLLEPGVYVAMNGRVLPWSDVEKNRDLGVFKPLSH